MTLAKRLKQCRIEKKLTQEQLAKKIGKGQSLIGNLETGIRSGTSMIAEIANILGVDAYYLRTGKEKNINNDKIIIEIIEILKKTSLKGRVIILNKALDIIKEYPIKSKNQNQKGYLHSKVGTEPLS